MDDMQAAPEARGDYWNEYYAKSAKSLSLPSQFALFAAGEIDPKFAIVDIGCGTGRDSLFFSTIGREVVGVDGSQAAVDYCSNRSSEMRLNARFVQSRVDVSSLPATVRQALSGNRSIAVYARFFIHAITEVEEHAFFGAAAELCQSSGLLAVEFRTERDSQQEKVTEAHYRRYVSPLKFMHNASQFGFRCSYFVEGFGYAKYKQDDAHVARLIMSKL